MTYDEEVGGGDSNKSTYCGCYFSFTCYSKPYSGLCMKVFVGKVGEQSKCIFDKRIGGSSVGVAPAELSDTEMIFVCSNGLRSGLTKELYKYKVGDEQAQLIYTLELNGSKALAVTCYNGDIYLFLKQTTTKQAHKERQTAIEGSFA